MRWFRICGVPLLAGALVAGLAGVAPGDGPEQLSTDDYALSVAACDTIGGGATEIAWCVEAETAAAIDPEIDERAGEVDIAEDGDQITATLPESATVLVTSHPGGES